MTPDDVPRLEMALAKEFPKYHIQVFNVAGRLQVAVSTQLILQAPASMHYTALDWREWLHRFTEALRERLK